MLLKQYLPVCFRRLQRTQALLVVLRTAVWLLVTAGQGSRGPRGDLGFKTIPGPRIGVLILRSWTG